MVGQGKWRPEVLGEEEEALFLSEPLEMFYW